MAGNLTWQPLGIAMSCLAFDAAIGQQSLPDSQGLCMCMVQDAKHED